MSSLYLSAAHKSSGKTTISIGLCAALRQKGLAVQPFKKGPDYIDPLWLTAASGRPCINLDFYTMERAEIEAAYSRAMQGADIAVVEGNKGLYDGMALDGSDSNAAMATLLQLPVLLVIDTRGITRGIAPLLLGYQAFAEELNIAGVILNRVAGERHEGKLLQVVEHYTDLPVVGAVHNSDALAITERHLGLVPSNEADEARAKIGLMGRAVAEQVDLERVIAVAATAPAPRQFDPVEVGEHSGAPLRIGYPLDRAFGFYYPDDLQAMAAAGAKLVPFDSLHDPQLPDVDGLFLGGGFPEVAMAELEANRSLREDIHRFIEEGGVVYAECGGLMYLARTLTWQGVSCEMVGTIPGDAVMYDRPQGRGYVRLRETDEAPWVDGERRELAAHEFHYSTLENLDSGLTFAYEVLRGYGVDGEHDGIVYKNMLANYAHMRSVGGNRWVERFIAQVRRVKGYQCR